MTLEILMRAFGTPEFTFRISVYCKTLNEQGFFLSDFHEKLLGFRRKILGFGGKFLGFRFTEIERNGKDFGKGIKKAGFCFAETRFRRGIDWI